MSDCSNRSAAESSRLPHLGWCRLCGRTVHEASLSDKASHAEFLNRSCACQPCQDALALVDPAIKRGPAAPVLHGVVFGAVVDGSRILEAAVVPFQYDPAYLRFDYEPGDVLRAGAVSASADPLASMRPAWVGRRERVLHLASVTDPLLALRVVRNHLVIALDGEAAGAVSELCPTLLRPPLVDLGAEIPWDSFGGSLDHLVRPSPSGDGVRFVSALHQCAVVARLLELPALTGERVGASVFDHVLLDVVVPAALALREASGGPCH